MPKKKGNKSQGGKQASGNGAQKTKVSGKHADGNVKQAKNVTVPEATPKLPEKRELAKMDGDKEPLNDWSEFDEGSCNLPSSGGGNKEKTMDSYDRSWENSQSNDRQAKKGSFRNNTSPGRKTESERGVTRTHSTERNSKRESESPAKNEKRASRWDKSEDDTSSESTQNRAPTENKNRNNYQNSGNYRGGHGSQDPDHQDWRTDKKPFKGKRNEGNWSMEFKGSPNRNNESNDQEYKGFWIHLKESRKVDYIKVREIDGDLFAMPKEHSLAHCVAEDMAMGSGIAVQFSRDFKRRDELLQQRQKQGGLAILEIGNRFIYYLVTKRQSTGKPTMLTLWNSLQKLKNHVEEHKVTKLAMPRIGCGLDRLEWFEVKAMIEYTFRNTEIEITVCNFQQPEDGSSSAPPRSFKCKVQNVEYPLVQIEAYTAIVYFGSEDGFVTEEIQSLDTKFKILQDYKTTIKKEGDVIRSVRLQNTYVLYGFIVKKSRDDQFGFTNLQKCLLAFKKLNTKESASEYVGIQAFVDKHDDLIIDKIVNILGYGLRGVEIYVCWPVKLAPFMPQSRRDFY